MADQSIDFNNMESAELYRACRDGHAQAEAYQALWVYLRRVAQRITYDLPDSDALAQDCAQVALIRVHQRLDECTQPAAFHAWARRIVTNVAIDELRRQKRLLPMADDDDHDPDEVAAPPLPGTPGIDIDVLDRINLAELRALIERAPISERSARVVLGRYFDNLPDEILAQKESALSGKTVLPSHVQVTRTKDIARLRSWPALRAFLQAR